MYYTLLLGNPSTYICIGWKLYSIHSYCISCKKNIYIYPKLTNTATSVAH